MNLDLHSQLAFGDSTGLQAFFLLHRFVHEQEARALSDTYGGAFSTFGLSSQVAEGEWASLMRAEPRQPIPAALSDWLRFHAAIHNITFQTIQSGGVAPDLSVTDFSQPTQFYDWMFVHTQMHDYEQQTLGLT